MTPRLIRLALILFFQILHQGGAMTPGPEVIISCPECKALSRFSTMASGNTFGSTLWSDGYRYSPMLEPSVPVIQCHNCSKIFLKWKAEEVGQYSRFSRGNGVEEETPAEWKRAPRIKAPKEEDFYKAIDEGLLENKQEEKNIRLTAWWQSNDRCRKGFSLVENKNDFPAPKEREKNMEKLLGLLDRTNPNDQIMAAEILRQLGRFDEAIEQLSKLDRDVFWEVISQLEEWCDACDPKVQKLTFSR